MDEKMYVTALENGTVIDHLPPGLGLKVVAHLKLNDHKQKVTVGMNMYSKSMGYKDVIKVEGRSLNQDEASKIAILAPNSTINIIENYQVVKKFRMDVPKLIEKMFSCPNPHCITNHEGIATLFVVKLRGKLVELSCNYCEKSFSHDSH